MGWHGGDSSLMSVTSSLQQQSLQLVLIVMVIHDVASLGLGMGIVDPN